MFYVFNAELLIVKL